MIWHFRVKSPKTGVGRHALPTKSGSLLPAALYLFFPELCPRTRKSTACRCSKQDAPCSSFRCRSPIQLRERVSKGGPCPRPSSPREGFPKGKAPKRRRGRIKRGAFEEMARLAAHQGRKSYSHDGVRAAALALCVVGGPGRSRNALVLFFRGVGRVLFQKRMRPTSLRWEPPPCGSKNPLRVVPDQRHTHAPGAAPPPAQLGAGDGVDADARLL